MAIAPRDDEDEPKLEEWDPDIRKPIELKRESRQEWHALLWLQGKTYREIGELTGWGRNTIWEDIKEVQTRWAQTPISNQDVRTLALMSLRILRTEIMQTIDEAKDKDAPYNQIAKLYTEAAGIDKLILTRYTQPQGEGEAVAAAEERAMIVIDYFTEKYGAEALAGFEEYYNRRVAQKRVLRN